jgi:hypothetical protein
MPRIKKTSSQPKRKPKKVIAIPKKVYPEYVQSFIDEILSKTPYRVVAAQYSIDSGYSIGVIKQNGKVWHCIWSATYAKTKEELDRFWTVKFDQ